VALKQSLRKLKQRNNRSRWHVVFAKTKIAFGATKQAFSKALFGAG
jgi:hypothetical protein